MTMMLVVDRTAAEDQQGENNMLSDDEANDNLLLGKPPPTDGDGEADGDNDTDTAGLSSSEAEHILHQQHQQQQGGSSSSKRKGSSVHRRRKSRSPSRLSPDTARDGGSSSSRKPRQASSKVKSRGGVPPSRSRSFADSGEESAHPKERRSRSGRRRLSMTGTNVSSEDVSNITTSEATGSTLKTKTSSSSRDGKSYKTNSGSSSGHRRMLSTSSVPKPSLEKSSSKGEKRADTSKSGNGTKTEEAKERRRRSMCTSRGSEERDNDDHLSSYESLPPATSQDSGSSRKKHTAASSSETRERRARSKSRSRSARKVLATDGPEKPLSSKGASHTESTLDSNSTEPGLSLRSSVKVASALVKFRKVLAMSKQATASAQKYRNDQEKQANEIGMDELGQINTSSMYKENVKNGNGAGGNGESQHKREGVNGASSNSSHHRRDAGSSQHKRDAGSSRHKRDQRNANRARGSSSSQYMSGGGSSSHSKREARREIHQDRGESDQSAGKGRTKESSAGMKDSSTAIMKDSSTAIMKDSSTEMVKDSSGKMKCSSERMRDFSNCEALRLKDTSETKNRRKAPVSSFQASDIDADEFLKQALNDVGKRLSKSASVQKKDDLKADEKNETVIKPAGEAPTSSIRIKSSAKVSTAVLKFQQALALSKSATRAAKTQQDTQNKLLGEVHADKMKPEEYLTRASFHKAEAGSKVFPRPSLHKGELGSTAASNSNGTAATSASPVSAVDVMDPTAEGPNESPKVPSDLDGDSDIDSEIEIDDVDDDDDPVSDVETDSEDEDANKPLKGVLENPLSVVVPTAPPAVNVDSDGDMGSDIDDHSDVDIDSDDDLDSDEEVATDAEKAINQATDIDSGNEAEMDSDDDIESDNEENVLGSTNGSDLQVDIVTPTQSSVNASVVSALRRQSETLEGDNETDSKERQSDGSKVAEISKRLLLVRSMSFDSSSMNGHQSSQSLSDRSLTDWKSSSGLIASNAGPNLAIPGLSPGSRSSLTADDDSQHISYLPVSMKKSQQNRPADLADSVSDEIGDGNSDMDTKTSASDSEANNPSRKDLTRKSSRRSVRRSRSNIDTSAEVDPGRKNLGDEKSGSGTRSSSRLRRAPSRSRSSSMVRADQEGGAHRDRKSKTNASLSLSGDKARSTDRSKSKDRGVSRSSSSSRSRILAGVTSFTTVVSQSKTSSGGILEKQEEGKRVSSRRRTPNRAKSHDGNNGYRKSSRSSASKGAEKDARERRSRKSTTLETDEL